MADTAARADSAPDIDAADQELPEVIFVTPEEGRRMFDEAARRWMGMSGEEFLRRYDTGEFDEVADKPGYRHILHLEGLIGFARHEP